MVSRTYNILVVAVTLSAVLVVAGVNIVVDPGAIYLRKYLTNSEVDLYASTMVTSRYGMVFRDDERNVRLALARIARRFDCVILGSSHVMSVSSHKQPSTVSGYCNSLLNLGVGGGGIEDLVIFIYTMASEHQMPRRIIIGIDAWTLNFESDVRWKEHEDIYKKALEAFKIDDTQLHESYWTLILKNLVNADYFDQSVLRVGKEGARTIIGEHLTNLRNNRKIKSEKLAPLVVGKFDYSAGSSRLVTLPDGSVIYSKEFIDASRKLKRPVSDYDGNKGYKIVEGRTFSTDAVLLLTTVIRYLKEMGVDLYFLLTPYHPDVWNEGTTLTTSVLTAVSAEVHRLGHELGIPTIGSYNPDEVRCADDEFFDSMHPRQSCLSKVFMRRDDPTAAVATRR